MKKRKIQVVVVLFIAAVTLLFSSFGRQVDIEERVLCHAMGVDYENGEYNVSLHHTCFRSSLFPTTKCSPQSKATVMSLADHLLSRSAIT